LYLPGALAQVAAISDLHKNPFSLSRHPESLDVATLRSLRKVLNLVVGVEILEQDNNLGLLLLGRPDLTTVLIKLHVFRLIQFSKIIFLDADVLPIRPLDHL
jgi:glycogenin